MNLRKAAEMGLDALEANLGKWRAKTLAIEALRQALAQPAWVGLTDEEKGWCGAPTLQETVTRVEAKLKEKNT